MEYISAILGHVVPIISEASKSQFGLMSLIALIALAIVLLFLYLTARTRPVLSFVLALVAILLMFGGVVGLVLSVDVRKPAIVYDADMLQRLQTVGFKIPHLEDATSTDYELLDGMLQRQPDGTWHERQDSREAGRCSTNTSRPTSQREKSTTDGWTTASSFLSTFHSARFAGARRLRPRAPANTAVPTPW